MRPPVLPSGNILITVYCVSYLICFNEAAGFTQRKQISFFISNKVLC